MDASHVGKPSAGTVSWDPPLPEAEGFEHVVIETPGLRSHVAIVGEGRPVLLLHGFPQHWWQWRRVAPAISRHGYRVICPDLRGAGWTAADEPGIRHEARMHDVLAMLDVLGIERADVLTHDLGAITGMHLAYTHPERVRTLVQLAVPPGFMRFTPKIIPAFRHYPSLVMSRRDRSLRWLIRPPYTVAPMTEEILDGYLRVETRPEVRRAARPTVLGMITPELPRLVGTYYKRRRLQPPTLVAFGRRDHPFTEPTVRGMCRDHERVAERFELAFVEDAAHFITDDAPDAVVALAIDWFQRGPA